MNEQKFRVGDVVSVGGVVLDISIGPAGLQVSCLVRVGDQAEEHVEAWVDCKELTVVQRKLSIGDKVTSVNPDPVLLNVDGEIIGIHSDKAWIIRDDGTYTVCPLAGLKAV